ncbi:LysR family transcriptional regulator ArgP [Compostimonas suwonensis]|uniref:HTH-type transcriptional regulator LysG n=1 Tax=Compostimonas suwonensis TaxID=1048394 RepID=A0A2M9BB29_9MICO|nr:LysR family transcriptional regulator ArgP [Compostimonas suwonensis]PJJ55151.1 LysR family transcriptional regulator (chromosome initiation inhibitor) [Compostimonas suwonensis]
MELQLDQLSTLAAVVDNGSFENAARAMRITPSAVSQRIKSLEQQLGRVLLQRSKPVRATESGQVLVRLARQFAVLEREAFEALGAGDGSGRTVVPLVVNADSLATWILPALARVPELSFELHLEDQDHSTVLLRKGTVMAAVTSEPEAVQGCIVRPLGSMQYRAMASPAFAERWFPEGPTPEALAVAPMVVFDRKDELQDRYLRLRTRRQLHPPRNYVPASTDFVEAVVLGLGWAALPGIQVEGRLAEGLLVELDPGHPVDVPLYWQQWALESTMLADVADTLSRAAAELLR